MSVTLSSILAAMIFVSPVYAAGSELTVETGIDKTMEIPLTLDADTDEFYVNGNLNPGDVMRATVYFKNTSKSPVQVRIADVIDQKDDTLSAQLMEILNLSISMDGSIIYEGNHKNVTSPMTQWIELDGGDIITMNISVEFPKEEADNTFQGAEMRVKYVFEARADVPPDIEEQETTSANKETIKTGVEEEQGTNYIAIGIMAGAVVLAVVGLVVSNTMKKKKKDSM